jgi:hemolysin activation/secretion protein
MRCPYNNRPGGNVRCVVTIIFHLRTRTNFKAAGKHRPSRLVFGLAFFLLLCFCAARLPAAEPATLPDSDAVAGSSARYVVRSYAIEGRTLLATNIAVPLLAKYTGTNVSMDEIVRAATDLEMEYHRQGFPAMNIVIAEKRITNGIVPMDVFAGAFAQIVVSGKRYWSSGNGGEAATNLEATAPAGSATPPAESAGTAPHAAPPAIVRPVAPATPEQMAQARAGLMREMAVADFIAKPKDTRIHVVSTNAGPRFAVEKYLVMGNTVLTPDVMGKTLTNIDGAFGTNVSFAGIRTAVEQLQGAYRERGYVTVSVGVPQQKLTNATVKLQVTEGRLAAIEVKGNHYFSSNNVMRALPSLHTNMILNGLVFQAELNRANANRDRQIYPVISPGPDPGTSALMLKVKDQLPVHGKLEFNNQSTPGTPDMRVNASVEADNLWQLGHSLGLQYGFSPQQYKSGSQWDYYDQPLVANYSAFYRMPLGNPESIEDVIAGNPGSFGYDEATRRFNLPPPSGATELNVYASRSTIDTGLENLLNTTLFDIPDVRQVSRQEVQQGITVNQDIGLQLTRPLPPVGGFNSTLSGGLDFKTYLQDNYQTNIFTFTEYTKGPNQNLIKRVSYDYVPTPTTEQKVEYLPLGLTYNGGLNDFLGPATLGLGLSANLWYSSSTLYTPASTNQPNIYGLKSLRGITGSSETTGHWVILRPSFSQNFEVVSNWTTSFRADGQFASEPLISNEQFGIGGVNSVRGYHEGEVFGDTGWHVSLEQQTPPHLVGLIHGDQPLTLRGSVYMDLATAYLIDPNGRPGRVKLWGTGFGFVASAGPHWQARFLFSLPLIGTSLTEADAPYFNFALTSQF